jgi:hypothetical protein
MRVEEDDAMPQQTSVFVSHCHEDNLWCRTFVSALERAGADVWYDEKSLGHGILSEEIERELRTRRNFIAVLSPSAIASPWVRREVTAAIHLRDREPDRVVLPVIAEQCDVPLLWSEFKWVSGSDDAGLPAEEAAQRVILTLGIAEPASLKKQWDEASVFASLTNSCTPEGLRAARHLYDFARQHGATFTWGTGPLPSVSARFAIGSRLCYVFTLYEWPVGKVSFAINFEYLTWSIEPPALYRLADQMRQIPGVADRYAGLELANFKKRPALSVDQILTQPGAIETIESSLAEFVHA